MLPKLRFWQLERHYCAREDMSVFAIVVFQTYKRYLLKFLKKKLSTWNIIVLFFWFLKQICCVFLDHDIEATFGVLWAFSTFTQSSIILSYHTTSNIHNSWQLVCRPVCFRENIAHMQKDNSNLGLKRKWNRHNLKYYRTCLLNANRMDFKNN